MSRWDRYWHGGVARPRLRLLVGGVLVLLTLDCLLLMLPHGSRYGAGGFNVAHFGWVDAVLGTPSAGLYAGILLLTAMLAAVLLLGGARHSARWMLLVLYTASWAISMLDSFQHHWFLTIVLLAIALLPRQASGTPARAAIAGGLAPQPEAEHGPRQRLPRGKRSGAREPDDVRPVSAWSYVLLAWSIAILYTFAAVAKLEPLWWNGHVLRAMVGADGRRLFEAAAQRLGVDAGAAWAAAATAVIPVELALALCYVTAVRRDELPWARYCGRFGALLALGLHGGAELLDLRIGWFSYYMLLFAAVFLLPASWLARVERAARAPFRTAGEWFTRAILGRERGVAAMAAAMAAAAGVLLALAYWIDLPGAVPALGLAATAVIALGARDLVAGRREANARRLGSATAAAAAICILLAAEQVRYDFYRYLGGDLRRRGETRAALDAYRRAERHAPTGKSRGAQIDEIERELRAGDREDGGEAPDGGGGVP